MRSNVGPAGDILTALGHTLVQGSLTDDTLLAETEAQPVVQILPRANVVKVGGQSSIDRAATSGGWSNFSVTY